MHATRQIRNLGLSLGLVASMCLSAWAAPNFKTLTDAPKDVNNNGTTTFEKHRRLSFSDGAAIITLPDSGWSVNHAGAMGADYELFNEKEQTRLGLWGGQSIESKAPRQLVGEWVNNLRSITGGDWSTPRNTTIGGIPVVQAYGIDAYGNYYYRVVSFTKFGQHYALALRTPYQNRWNTDLEHDIATMVINSHVGPHATPKLRDSIK